MEPGDSDQLGHTVSNGGDINGDGMADILLGAQYATAGGRSAAGMVYVIYGRSYGFSSDIDLSISSIGIGFNILGALDGDSLGGSVE